MRKGVGWWLALGVVLGGTAASTASGGPLQRHDELFLPDGTRAAARRPSTRSTTSRTVESDRSLEQIRREAGGAWFLWSERTGLPSRILLAGVDAPGVMTSPRAAVEFTRAYLQRHLSSLAPGTDVDDFVVVSNDLSADIRSVGYAQHHRGIEVLGAQLSFRFKADRLIAIGVEAHPNIAVAAAQTRVAPQTAGRRALQWVRSGPDPSALIEGAVAGPFILPIDTGSQIRYREVYRIVTRSPAGHRRWATFVDSASGEPVALANLILDADVTLHFNVPQRYPGGGRVDRPATGVKVIEPPSEHVTDESGLLSTAFEPTTLDVTVEGPLVALANEAGESALESFEIAASGPIVWDAADSEAVDAQLSGFVHATIGKDYVRGVAPELAWIDQQLTVHVNIDENCNAASDGDSLFFRRSGGGCENTARIADVVYHELGHSVHVQSLIPGVGQFNGSLSEGTSDYLAATITGDPDIAKGFFMSDEPLRRIDPVGFEYTWPEHRGEVHDEGRIIAGTLWDLRKLLVAKLGENAGVEHSDHLWYEATRRAVDIPSMYVETLVVDDDDGNLGNGTPNACEINAAFGAHGLFSVPEGGRSLAIEDTATGHRVALYLAIPSFPGCPVSASPLLQWRLRRDDTADAASVALQLGENGSYVADIPEQPAGEVLQYRVLTQFSNGTEGPVPENLVDPYLEHFIGPVTPLYCTGFEDALDWTLGTGFEVGPPAPASTDPMVASDEDGVLLQTAGDYLPSQTASAKSPVIATLGYRTVRLQYRRWLAVEDGFFDQARVLADGSEVWANHASTDEDSATFHHLDRQWRFHDIDLSEQAEDGSVQIEFQLTSDGGLEFGGWSIDSLCVVAVGDAVGCGDGVVDLGETCDDGNTRDGDGCDAQCRTEDDPDPTGGSVPPTEDSDGTESTGPGEDHLGLVGRGCDCRFPNDRGPSPWLLAIVALWRRRRASSPSRL